MRRKRLCGALAVGALAFVVTLAAPARAEIAGLAEVIDGDTLAIGDTLVDLHGIDAPEAGQLCARGGKPWACGAAAARLLFELVAGKQIRCEEKGRDSYGRIAARCKADWLNLGAEMVTRGMALADLRVSSDYIQNYREARGKGNGIFAGVFVEPARWRRGERLAIEIASAAGACLIKGQILVTGARVYLLPGEARYAEAAIAADRGERWFCTEEEALAAGWRKARP